MLFATGEPITTFLLLTALSVALSVAAGALLNKREDVKQDQKPTQLSTRGSFMSWFIGIEKIGPVFCWAGGRAKRKEKAEGGKGGAFSTPKVDVWYESGMHVLCVGPCHAIHQITANNEVLLQGPITYESHPSGTLVDLGKHGSFRVFWGEEDQPINTWLGDASRIGIDSRWRCICYVEWRSKRLGQTAVWPSIEYVVERRPQETQLSDTAGWIGPTLTLDGTTYTIDAVQNGVEGTGYFRVDANIVHAVPPSTTLRLTGNAISDQDLVVLKTATVEVGPFFTLCTKIYPEGGLSGADANGSLQVYTEDSNDGANPAHIVAEALFDPWPHGLGMDSSFWDMESLETMGTDLLAEDTRSSCLKTGGSYFSDIVGEALEDLGYVLPISHETGLLTFRKIREPSRTVEIPYDAQQQVPEVSTSQSEQAAQSLIYGFRDRNIEFRKMTFKVDDDGQATLLEHKGYKTVDLDFTNVPDVAAMLAQRRSQEVLGEQTKMRFQVNRGGRTLIPGDAVTVEGFPGVMRVTSNQVDTESGVVSLEMVADAYGVADSDFAHSRANPDAGREAVAPDLAAALVEVPEYLLQGDPQTVIVPRIRAHDQISNADVYLSSDGSSYTLFGIGANAVPGGELSSTIAVGDAYYQAQGPTITILGPDVDEILNLIGDETSWGLGRQLVFINNEIFFLKNVTSLGGSSYRLDGLVRARYDTVRSAHSIGDKVFIMRNDVFFAIQDILLQPEENLYAKAQPRGIGTILLSAVEALSQTPLYGKGVRPVPISGLRVSAPSLNVAAYGTGDDITLDWGYGATLGVGTGAGMQGAGTAVGQADPDGQFKLEILTTLDVLKRTEILDDPTYTYTNVNLQADLGSETSFKVRVTQLRNGYQSDTVTLTVEKV